MILKYVHVVSAILSISGFILRGYWMLRESPRRHARAVRILPHVVDTVLLLAGIGLALNIRQYPFVDGWLTAKVLALGAYIVAGAVALHYGPTRRVRTIAWFGAIAIFAYIVAVARTRDAALGLL